VLALSAEKLTVLDLALNQEGGDFGYFRDVRDSKTVEEKLNAFAKAEKADEKALAKEIALLVMD